MLRGEGQLGGGRMGEQRPQNGGEEPGQDEGERT